jgi:hypothetical protein
VIDPADSESDDEPIAFTESKVFSMSSITMNSIVLRYGDSPLVGALRAMQLKAAKELKGALQAWGGVKLEENGECV